MADSGTAVCSDCGHVEHVDLREKSGVTDVNCQRCYALLSVFADGRTEIDVHGHSASEVQQVSANLFSTVRSHDDKTKYRSAWANGSFYLFVAIAVMALTFVVAKVLPVWSFFGIVVAGVLLSTVIGAFQLRYDEKVSEAGFLVLIKLAFANLPLLRMIRSKQAGGVEVHVPPDTPE
jgi:hypothetical protein